MSRSTATRRGHTAGQHSFARVPQANIPRSKFDRSCGVKTAFDAGYLVPIFVDEAVPGDTMNLRTFSFARMATPIYPVMDNLFMDYFFFAVPYRLVWENWEKFNGAQDNPGDSTSFVVPQFNSHTPAESSLSDYMGIPIGNALVYNSLHHRAYNLIWNEWFRDENLQDSVVVDTDDGPDDIADYVLLRRGKRHDYFSSCLPFAQKGDAVSLPLGTSAPLSGTAALTITGNGIPTFTFASGGGGNLIATAQVTNTDWSAAPGAGQGGNASWNAPNLSGTADLSSGTADLSTATAATINELRLAFQTQKLLERDARGGSRYTEIVRAHFGVISPDQRLQRPEFLGGGSTRINMHPVARTNVVAGSFAADLSAFATSSADGIGFMKSFTEHCLIIGLVNVRADLTYQQGLNRMFSRQTRYDFYWPALAHIGEQAVLSKEIYADGSANDEDVFGYQERYAEYRYKPSIVTSAMRSTAAAPLDSWHLGLEFSSRPVLNDTFIQDFPPVSRVVAVTSEPEFIADFYFNYVCARPMPMYSVPGLIDHF